MPEKHLVDMVNDLWSIFECPECGILFFNEEKIAFHMKENHSLDYFNTHVFSVELIRAFPQSDSVNNRITET